MADLRTVTITNVSRKERTSARTGKSFTSLGLQVEEYGEKWLSGFDSAQTRNWKCGDKVQIDIEQNGDYLNFNVPRKDSSPAANSGATAEIMNAITLKVIPLLEKIIAQNNELYKLMNPRPADDFKMPDFGDEPSENSPF